MTNRDDWDKFAIASGSVILGMLLFKAIFDRDTRLYRCPTCNLVILRDSKRCPRCKTELTWYGVE